jgi:hypothetical protein
VAAIQYGTGDYLVPREARCSDELCGLSHYIKQAAARGARLVVTPEYALGGYQKVYEPAPRPGDRPATDPRFSGGDTPIIRTLARLADDNDIYLVFNVATAEGTGSAARRYNTSVAIDPAGKVVGRHYKFQLFGSEPKSLTAGASLETSFFETPVGKVGMMICADAQCIVYGMQPSHGDNQATCSAHAVDLLKEYFNLHSPRVVAFSALWTVGSGTWGSLNVQQTVARTGGVWLLGANTTKGAGYGGGIWDDRGQRVQAVQSLVPAILTTEIPLR